VIFDQTNGNIFLRAREVFSKKCLSWNTYFHYSFPFHFPLSESQVI
jgi:hypothetical protein